MRKRKRDDVSDPEERFWVLAKDHQQQERLRAMTDIEWAPWEVECRRIWARKSRDSRLSPALMTFEAAGIVDVGRVALARVPDEWRGRVEYIEVEQTREHDEHTVRLWIRGALHEVPDTIQPRRG